LTIDHTKLDGVVRALKSAASIPGVRIWVERTIAAREALIMQARTSVPRPKPQVVVQRERRVATARAVRTTVWQRDFGQCCACGRRARHVLKREGASHSLRTNPKNGAMEAVPRHTEIPNTLVRKRRSVEDW
jgi:hypothetical protein